MIALPSLNCMRDSMPDDKLPDNNQMLDEMQRFLQSAVHDLRAAHRRTGISAELLLDSPEDHRNDLVAQVLQGLSKSEEVLLGINKYATAMASGRYSMAVFRSASAVRFALANLDAEIRRLGAIVNIGDLPEIKGDRDRIADLFEQLLANSLKFRGADPPVIDISARRVPEGWLFSIKDNGKGIPGKYRSRLFIAFQRLEGADFPGAGLGLAISRKIVEAHNGHIWIDDEEGSGVTFSFVMPAIDGD